LIAPARIDRVASLCSSELSASRLQEHRPYGLRRSLAGRMFCRVLLRENREHFLVQADPQKRGGPGRDSVDSNQPLTRVGAYFNISLAAPFTAPFATFLAADDTGPQSSSLFLPLSLPGSFLVVVGFLVFFVFLVFLILLPINLLAPFLAEIAADTCSFCYIPFYRTSQPCTCTGSSHEAWHAFPTDRLAKRHIALCGRDDCSEQHGCVLSFRSRTGLDLLRTHVWKPGAILRRLPSLLFDVRASVFGQTMRPSSSRLPLPSAVVFGHWHYLLCTASCPGRAGYLQAPAPGSERVERGKALSHRSTDSPRQLRCPKVGKKVNIETNTHAGKGDIDGIRGAQLSQTERFGLSP
jgi:hypothetical protein